MRSSINIEVDFEVDYVIYPEERDVGEMYPRVGELRFYSTLTGKEIDPEDVMTQAQIEQLEEELLDVD